jgi:hypothetical protein
MTLSGEQWLARFFQPVVAAGPSRVLGARLAAQVEALGATGVLTGEQVRDALDVLEEAGVGPEVRSVSTSTFTSADVPVAVRAGSIAPTPVVEAPPVFRGVLGGPRELG